MGDDIKKELEQLRAEVAALSAARVSKDVEDAQTGPIPFENEMPETDEVNSMIKDARAAVADDPELKGQFDQLFEHLEQEIKDLPAITTLAVFSLGVLFGRLMR